MTESKRVKTFRLSLVKQIPKFPNNKASRQALEAKSLGSLLIAYANWAIRNVPSRPRIVVVEPTAKNDPRWQSLSADIQTLLAKVRQGDDLTPYLSLSRTRGFTPAASGTAPNVDKWADKDMLLNVMGYHHFHFDAVPHNHMRSDDVLFAHLTRDTFSVIGIFDHRVFESTDAARPMTSERDRLWRLFEERATRDMRPGSVVVPAMITTSGHSLDLVNLAMGYARVISKIDPKLDDLNYLGNLYQAAGLPIPTQFNFQWHLDGLDLAFGDAKAGTFFVVRRGPV